MWLINILLLSQGYFGSYPLQDVEYVSSHPTAFNGKKISLCGVISKAKGSNDFIIWKVKDRELPGMFVTENAYQFIVNGKYCVRGVISRPDRLSNEEVARQGKGAGMLVDDVNPFWRLYRE